MSRLSRSALVGVGLSVVLVATACAGSTSPGASSSGSPSSSGSASPSSASSPLAETNSSADGIPTEGTPAGTAPALDAKAACTAFNEGFAEYGAGAKDGANKNWLLLGAKMIDQADRSPAEVSGLLTALSDLAFARADAGGETAPSDKEKAVTDAVSKAMKPCSVAGVTLQG